MARVVYKNWEGKQRTKVVNTTETDPNAIIREFIKVTGFPWATFIYTVTKGKTQYQWHECACLADSNCGIHLHYKDIKDLYK